MESIKDIINRWINNYNSQSEIAEPITKPTPTIQPEIKPIPEENPWIYPQPLVNPTPKGFVYSSGTFNNFFIFIIKNI